MNPSGIPNTPLNQMKRTETGRSHPDLGRCKKSEAGIYSKLTEIATQKPRFLRVSVPYAYGGFSSHLTWRPEQQYQSVAWGRLRFQWNCGERLHRFSCYPQAIFISMDYCGHHQITSIAKNGDESSFSKHIDANAEGDRTPDIDTTNVSCSQLN